MNPIWLWGLLLAPLGAAVLIALITRPFRALSAALSIGAILFSFGVAVSIFMCIARGAHVVSPTFSWLQLPGFSVDWSFGVDRLSSLMLLVVTGVGAAIHIYSLAYMRDDPSFSRFFALLSFFTFSMLGIVLSTNFIQIYIFWELVGVSSYLLIGFWFEKPSAAEAGKKAFIVNRIGDFGLMLGILMLWGLTGSVDFAVVSSRISDVTPCALTVAGLLIFCGAVGKSAQLPLHVWLPDAMEGPTPVSALIHAATMVAAGVYMLCRVAWVLTPEAANAVAWIGGTTALLAAIIAIGQSDIKRVLAYSTMSQLGYMVMAVGLGGASVGRHDVTLLSDGSLAAMVHLTTHAFFKALLFLSAGSVIMALHHEQDIWKMGGLARRMPGTFIAFLVGTLALAGVWPLSGFYTKDAILVLAYEQNRWLFAFAAVASVCTAFYMGRVLFVAFLGKPRDAHAGRCENGPVVLIPLAILSVLSIVAGWHGMIPHALEPKHATEAHSLLKNLLLLGLPFIGFVAAVALYARPQPSDQPLRRLLGPVYEWLVHRFYIDEFYAWLIRVTHDRIAFASDRFDVRILQARIIRGLGAGTQSAAQLVRMLQSGDLRFYVFLFGCGAVTLIYLAIHGTL